MQFTKIYRIFETRHYDRNLRSRHFINIARPIESVKTDEYCKKWFEVQEICIMGKVLKVRLDMNIVNR